MTDLENLDNAALIRKFDDTHGSNYAIEERCGKVTTAYINLVDLPGSQEDAECSRQTIIYYIKEEDELMPVRKPRRLKGGRKTIKIRRSRKGKKNKRRRKSRK